MRYFFPLLFIVPYVLMAQGTDIELGITGGTTIYVGDLSGSLSEYSTKDLGYTAGVFLRNNFKQYRKLSLKNTGDIQNLTDRTILVKKNTGFFNSSSWLF